LSVHTEFVSVPMPPGVSGPFQLRSSSFLI
jgi:hypothetical protein